MQRVVVLLFSCLMILGPSLVLRVSGCSIASSTVAYALNGNKNQPGFFTPVDVSAHMNLVTSSNSDVYARDGASTLSCVDARSDQPVIGTPGGDLAEFAIGLSTYHTLTSQVGTYSSVKSLFQLFMNTQISASRPFYFHTDDTRLRQVFQKVGVKLNQNITVLPGRPSAADQIAWREELVQSYAQGCGHIRLMIENPTNYGLPSAQIIQWLIRAFYEELWEADSDAKRAKLAFVVKVGPLQGKAVAIVTNKAGTCTGYSPGIPPNIGGSTLFVYTPSAASAFRSTVLMPFFAARGAEGWNATLFQSGVTDMFNKQLGATLTNLSPANQASLITIDVTTSGQTPAPSSVPQCQQNTPVASPKTPPGDDSGRPLRSQSSASVSSCAIVVLSIALSALLACL